MGKNDTPEVRLDQMATWAAGVNEQLADLTAAMIVTTEENADSISLQLSDLLGNRNAQCEQYKEALKIKAQLGIEVSSLKEKMQELEASAMIDISFELGDDGKQKYSSDAMRKAAVKRDLATEQTYQALRDDLRNKERDIAHARAMLEMLDRETKEYGRAVDILTSRLNNLTARVR